MYKNVESQEPDWSRNQSQGNTWAGSSAKLGWWLGQKAQGTQALGMAGGCSLETDQEGSPGRQQCWGWVVRVRTTARQRPEDSMVEYGCHELRLSSQKTSCLVVSELSVSH